MLYQGLQCWSYPKAHCQDPFLSGVAFHDFTIELGKVSIIGNVIHKRFLAMADLAFFIPRPFVNHQILWKAALQEGAQLF